MAQRRKGQEESIYWALVPPCMLEPSYGVINGNVTEVDTNRHFYIGPMFPLEQPHSLRDSGLWVGKIRPSSPVTLVLRVRGSLIDRRSERVSLIDRRSERVTFGMTRGDWSEWWSS